MREIEREEEETTRIDVKRNTEIQLKIIKRNKKREETRENKIAES